jgi:hypothetical protein
VKARVDALLGAIAEAGDQGAMVAVAELGFGAGLRALFPDGALRLTLTERGRGGQPGEPASGAGMPGEARAIGSARVSFAAAPASLTLAVGEAGTVVLRAEAGGCQVICTGEPLAPGWLTGLGLPDAGRGMLPYPFAAELPAGTWLLPPEMPLRWPRVLVPLALPRPALMPNPSRLDGLGRPLPVPAPEAPAGAPRPLRAAPATGGFALLAGTSPGAERGNGRWRLDFSEDGAVVNVDYDYSPLRVSGALGLLPTVSPYQAIVGGVLMFSFGAAGSKGLYGTGMGAYMVPASGQAMPSFFGYAGIGGDPGIGIPAIRVTGISAGLGWNSRIRIPEISQAGDFPFLKALDNPAAIGAERDDPVQILQALVTGDGAWVTPAADELWVAAGLGFTIAELVSGRAVAIVQAGPELTIALVGSASAELPKEGNRKYARIAAALRAVLKPNQGELAFDAELTSGSFVIDPNCRLRGGVAFRAWFTGSPHAGDFVYTVGGYHPRYRAPGRYPVVPRLGFDWDLTGSVTISGSAYLAITPSAAMAGGKLDVRFHSGVVRAWCTAEVDALLQWKPFYLDAAVRVSIGVSASVKIIFVRITITVEIGVALAIWGPPAGGKATVKLWFISFTIGFGKDREASVKELDWPGFAAMLPPAGNNVRVTPGPGLVARQRTDARSGGERWNVSANGFTFSTDSTVPLSRLFLGDATSPAESGPGLDIRPMNRQGLTSNQRVKLTRNGAAVDLGTWARSRATATVPAELWGAGRPGGLPAGDGHLVKDRLVGLQLASPAPRHGTSTGYMDEKALAFDPVKPDGIQPLDPAAGPAGASPQRPPDGGVIAAIAATIAAPGQEAARARLAGQLRELGLRLGVLDTDLSRYARAAQTAFTAEPMLVPAS